MRFDFTRGTTLTVLVLGACAAVILFADTVARQIPGNQRAQHRTYGFGDTNEELPYCVFVSSKVSKDKKNPLIISLHGLGASPAFMCQGRAIELAEEGGYILAAPMGYSVDGWYGSRALPRNLAERSEQDVLNVLAMMREEFTVDERRTYLMGYSMGGAGTYFLGSKHASEWAAIAAIAPAVSEMSESRAAVLRRLKDSGVPVMTTQGDRDDVVPAANTRAWVGAMKDLSMTHEYKEIAGADHATVVNRGMADIFAFFEAHARSATSSQHLRGQ